jgi:AAHS family benzoate transporter-like MFS transporter
VRVLPRHCLLRGSGQRYLPRAGRLIVGLGLGAVLPTLNAYVADLSEPEHRSRNVTLTMSGYAAEALLSPLLGTALLPDVSYHGPVLA